MQSFPEPQKRRKSFLLFAVVTTAILVGAVGYYFHEKSTPLKIVENRTGASVYNSSTGLQLILGISNTTILSGQNETISLQIYNALGSVNSVEYGRNYSNLPSTYVSPGPCSNQPYGIALLYGNYSLNTLNNAQPLQIFEPGEYFCPAMFHISKYQFFGHSSKAKVYSGTQSVGTTNFNETVNLSGSWNGNYKNHQFEILSAGIYSVVAADGWNQVVVLHFVVEGPVV